MKGVIIAAGYGTRFLPITKSIPKEMFPLINRPAIEFVVNEFLDSGIEDILIISSRRKKVMEDYFDRDLELEGVFEREHQVEKLQKLMRVSELADVHFIRQKEMRGTAHAIALAHSFVGNKDPFIVAYPDDIFVCKTPLSKQLIDIYERTDKHVLSAMEIPRNEVSRYGIIDPFVNEETGIIHVRGLVEKPSPDKAPSNLMSAGRYLFKPEIIKIFTEHLSQIPKGEVTQTPAIDELAKKGAVVAHIINGERLDLGTPGDYIKTFTLYTLQQPEYRKDYLAFLENLLRGR